MNSFLLDFLALGAIFSGILVIISKNPVISVLFLISVFINVAGYLLVLGVGFIGISYLIVYVGAIAILFLFVVMMLNLQLAELTSVGKEYTQNLPLGLLLGSLFIFELASLSPNVNAIYQDANAQASSAAISTVQETELGIFHSITNYFLPQDSFENNATIYSTFSIGEEASQTTSAVDSIFMNYYQIQSIGQNLYTSASLWLILASTILLLAMVGPIVLSLSPTKEDELVKYPFFTFNLIINQQVYIDYNYNYYYYYYYLVVVVLIII